MQRAPSTRGLASVQDIIFSSKLLFTGQITHQFIGVRQEASCFPGGLLAVADGGSLGVAAAQDRKRNGGAGMGAHCNGGGVIRHHHNGPLLAAAVEPAQHRADNLLVDLLDAPDFFFELRLMTALIGSFDVDIDKIAVGRERLNCGFALPLEVGVEISGCALHRDAARPHPKG